MEVSPAQFAELVADALDAVPEHLAVELENVAIVVEEWPTQEQIGGRGGTLFGLYEGVPLTARDPISYGGVVPDKISIFRGPLCASARDEHELAQQVRITVLHEIGHYFGIDDARLHELGWA
jgi:predicted Zn-dependent protease with MMP-like domain